MFFRINLNLNNSITQSNATIFICCSYTFDNKFCENDLFQTSNQIYGTKNNDILYITNYTLNKIIFTEPLYLYVYSGCCNKNDEVSYISFLKYLRLNCNPMISIYFEDRWNSDDDNNLCIVEFDSLQHVYSKVKSDDYVYCLLDKLFENFDHNLYLMKGNTIFSKKL